SDAIAQRTFAAAEFATQCPGGQALDLANAVLVANCKAASFHGLQIALAVMLGFYLLASLVYLLAVRHTAPRPALTPATAAT
ncbi:MAG: hypothetical protein JNL55_20640, partial [Steroidobacter sp.]